jgi:ribonuclease BN (tRNA processing enzyme)
MSNRAFPRPPFRLALLAVIAGCTKTPVRDASGASLAQPAITAVVNGRTRVVMLGTGTPNADPDRSGPAVAIVVDSQAYLVDAGPGVVRRAAAAARAGVPALQAPSLDHVFLTHLHSDHTLGLPDLLLSPWVLERTRPLTVIGPPGGREMIDHLLAAYKEDIRVRVDGLEPANNTGYRADVRIAEPGVAYHDNLVTVTAFAVPHGDWNYAFGYRFQTPDRVIVVSGDTRASNAVVDACRGCDVLVHEVYSAARLSVRPPEWQRYHRSAHTSTVELARLATAASPKLLLLYHQLYWGATDEDLLREIREAGYAGAVQSAHDLGIY